METRQELEKSYYQQNRERILESKRKAYALLSSEQKAALAEKKRERYLADRDRQLELRKEWWKANRESETEKQRSRYHSRTEEEKEERRKRQREYYERNPELQKRASERWIAKNREKVRQRAIRSYQNNKAKHDARSNEFYREHPEVAAIKNARRRAAKTNATPPWLSVEHHAKIAEFYHEAREMKKRTGIEHHVDHIIPLKNSLVCGLHVPWNLQILTEAENSRKRNKFAQGN